MRRSTPVHRGVVSGSGVAELQEWTSVVESWPAGSHAWGHYAELTPTGEAICRTENVSACHGGFRGLVDGPLGELSSSVLGVEVVAFKDKLNYKQPGGAGFSPHQDLAAYPGATEVISILVAVDECSLESGCLWAANDVDELLPTDDRGVVRSDLVASLDWSPVELHAVRQGHRRLAGPRKGTNWRFTNRPAVRVPSASVRISKPGRSGCG